MPITDLTGTTWLLNESITTAPNGQTFQEMDDTEINYNINFSSVDKSYTKLIFSGMAYNNGIEYYRSGASLGEMLVYTNGSWQNANARTINITGGTDVTNATLIAWLQANAIQQSTFQNKVFIGNNSIKKIFVGSIEVSKMFIGNTKVYEKGGS